MSDGVKLEARKADFNRERTTNKEKSVVLARTSGIMML
jgi:hypothetical protein